MKVALIAGYSPSLLNFRGPLLQAMRAFGHEVVALAPNDDPTVPTALSQLGIRFVPIDLWRASLNPVGDLTTLHQLVTCLRDIKPEKVLAYTPKPVIWGSLAARIAGVPDVYALITGLGRAFSMDEHASPTQRALNLTVRALYRAGLAACRGVMFQNVDDKALFETSGLLRKEQPTIVTAGSGVDLLHFAASEAPSTQGGVVFLTLTRLLVDKGVPQFVDAAAMLKGKYPNAQFRIVGPRESGRGGIPPDVLDRWSAEGHATLIPPVQDVRAELRRAHVFVLASAYREGVPRSVIEALSVGRAIVTTDTPGCRETILPGRNGFLVAPRNATQLADAMEQFLRRPELIGQMGRESRRLAEVRFDVDDVNAQILSFMGLTPRLSANA